MKISVNELNELAALVHKQSGIVLEKGKAYLIESRLEPLFEEHSLNSFTELIAKLKGSPKMVNQLIDLMTTNETSFFRDQKPYELLKNKLLPEWLGRQAGGRGKLNIWSSACSTGQEVYSIAMTLMDFFKEDLFHHQIKIKATDISDSAIVKASLGQYTQFEAKRGLDDGWLNKYFRQDGPCWKIIDELRSLAYFEKMNLLQSQAGPETFDVIFCRNVAIYFGKTDRKHLFDQLAQQLKENGVLIIGSTETLFGISDRFERREYQGASYYVLK